MRKGLWHQCGYNSQRLALEQLELGNGVGVIISPRDLAMNSAIEYAADYRGLDAEVLLDQQFYFPGFTNNRISTYPTNPFRMSVDSLAGLSGSDLLDFSRALEETNSRLNTTGLIAPAVLYETVERRDFSLNATLLEASKRVGDALGIPTFASVFLGLPVTYADSSIDRIISEVTSLNCDGWYFGFQFAPERIPSSNEFVSRCCIAGLNLASTGKPVIHAFAGPMAILSFAFGAYGAGIGHFKNLWRFCPERFRPGVSGGGQAVESRFFSSSLWGTIIYPDETALLPRDLFERVYTSSRFSAPVAASRDWERWDSYKHLLDVINNSLNADVIRDSPLASARNAISLLIGAIDLHSEIAEVPVSLRDDTNAYQLNWVNALSSLTTDYADTYGYLNLIG